MRKLKFILRFGIGFFIIWALIIFVFTYTSSTIKSALQENISSEEYKTIAISTSDSESVVFFTEKNTLGVAKLKKLFYRWRVTSVIRDTEILDRISGNDYGSNVSHLDNVIYGLIKNDDIASISINKKSVKFASINSYRATLWYIVNKKSIVNIPSEDEEILDNIIVIDNQGNRVDMN